MTPHELDMITNDHAAIATDRDGFASRFYEALFDLAPPVRSIYSSDVANQRSKLLAELSRLVAGACEVSEPAEVDALTGACKDLRRRHAADRATPEPREPVGSALLTTLREHTPAFDDAHERAWSALIGLVRSGAAPTAHLSSMMRVIDFVMNGTGHTGREHTGEQRNAQLSHQVTTRSRWEPTRLAPSVASPW